MKFSIVIPTKNRANLLRIVVKNAMQVGHSNFEVIVSDNSTTEEHRRLNIFAVEEYIGEANFRIVYPPQILAAPTHFEYALDYAKGDYIIYLTDKMLMIPGLLTMVEEVLEASQADIINWAYAPYMLEDVENPGGAGTLVEDRVLISNAIEYYDPLEALKFKAECKVPRNQQETSDYALGKIIFGAYSRALISRIRSKTGNLFGGGATHDYSAMIQALSMAGKCVMLKTYGVIFISLPRDKSLGSLTATDSKWALRYFQEFTNGKTIIESLLVPGIYASQHNMVAHDYIKYLPLFDHMDFFNSRNWLLAIYSDLFARERIWGSQEEKSSQLNLFKSYLKKNNISLKQNRARHRSLLTRLCRKRDQVLQSIFPVVSDSWSTVKFLNKKTKDVNEAIQWLRLDKRGKILIIYSPSQTYTGTVFEHLDAFGAYSAYECNYIGVEQFDKNYINLNLYDVVLIHYSIRLPFDQLSKLAVDRLFEYDGLKVLFLQDEYDNHAYTQKIIGSIGFNLVYTVVPEPSIPRIYPQVNFPTTKFINCFTGYVSDYLIRENIIDERPSTRSISIAYRGRPLPVWYGKLGFEKIEIGRRIKEYCRANKVTCDIAWDESARIYGQDWNIFISSAICMLGSESGSNVFDWDGFLHQGIRDYCKKNPNASTNEIYQAVVEKYEVDGLMNQISPRIFEMAAAKTVMVLMEGQYSGVLKPHVHYVPIKKDFSNLDEVFKTLSNGQALDAMAERAHAELILSGRYSYRQFIEEFDNELESGLKRLRIGVSYSAAGAYGANVGVTLTPLRAKPPLPTMLSGRARLLGEVLIAIWQLVPISIRPYIKKLIGRI